MMNPPLHSFMNSLFSGPAFLRVDDATSACTNVRCDEEGKEEEDGDELLSVQCVTKIVYKLSSRETDCQINIVQDNACVHAKAPLFPYHHHGGCSNNNNNNSKSAKDLDLSNSEIRWSNDSSSEKVPPEETSKKPRRPYRRLSVDFGCSPDMVAATTKEPAASTNNMDSSSNDDNLPKCPRRKGTVEFAHPPAAAPGFSYSSSKSLSPPRVVGTSNGKALLGRSSEHGTSSTRTGGSGTAPSPPRIPQRRGTMDLSSGEPTTTKAAPSSSSPTRPKAITRTNRRHSETLDGSAHLPRFPQRRNSNDVPSDDGHNNINHNSFNGFGNSSFNNHNSFNGSFSSISTEGSAGRRYSRSERVRNSVNNNTATTETATTTATPITGTSGAPPTRPTRRSSLVCTSSAAVAPAVADDSQRRSSCPDIYTNKSSSTSGKEVQP